MPETLSIVVPAYNEGTRLQESLPRIVAYLNDGFPDSELIVVDDGIGCGELVNVKVVAESLDV